MAIFTANWMRDRGGGFCQLGLIDWDEDGNIAVITQFFDHLGQDTSDAIYPNCTGQEKSV